MSSTSELGTASVGELLGLHQAGQLVSEYPKVRRLISDLPGDQLRRAGRLLSRLDPDEVLRAHPETRTVTVAITGHGTLNALIAPLTAELARHGLLLRPVLAHFDSYVFDLADPDSQLYAALPDLVLCVLDPAIVFDEVPMPWQPHDVGRVFDEKLELLRGLASRFQETGRGTLVLNTIPLPRELATQLVDYRSRATLGALWREGNARLLRLADTCPGPVVLDIDTLITGGIAATDPRLSTYGKAHLTPELLAAYAAQAGHLARHVAGQTKKLLAIDLDGTAWGGTLSDDGIDGIEVADGFRGQAFRTFQQAVRQLAAQGVLVAAVSKNDPGPVQQVLREHPGMLLREADFVRVAASWRPKHESLVELAADLNVGVDSIVFVDDSPYETGLIRRELPEVAVIQVGDEPAWHVRKLLADGWFDVIELTAEDHARPERYREELVRQDFLSSSASIQDYLQDLRVSVRVTVATGAEVGRLSQLTLRTNQFNLTAERLRPADVQALMCDPRALVLAVHAADRFGDNGLVGAMITHRAADTVYIDNFLLSCRVFARGVEQAALSALLRHAQATKADSVVGTYRRTERNVNVREFYARHGFETVTDDGDIATLRHELGQIAPPPAHVQLAECLERMAST